MRRLAKVFPAGSAQKEIERRKAERLRGGEMEARATQSVIESLSGELIDGRGVALMLRPHDDRDLRHQIAAQ